jgi:hypothetical protein
MAPVAKGAGRRTGDFYLDFMKSVAVTHCIFIRGAKMSLIDPGIGKESALS